MGGGIGSEGEMVSLGSFTDTIENDTGLDPRLTTLHIEIDDAIDILGKIEHHGNVATLAGKAGASASRKNGGVKFSAGGHGGFYIRGVERQYKTDGKLAIVGSVRGIEGAAAGIEANVAANGLAKGGFQVAMGREMRVRMKLFLFNENWKLRLSHFISSICWTSTQRMGCRRLELRKGSRMIPIVNNDAHILQSANSDVEMIWKPGAILWRVLFSTDSDHATIRPRAVGQRGKSARQL